MAYDISAWNKPAGPADNEDLDRRAMRLLPDWAREVVREVALRHKVPSATSSGRPGGGRSWPPRGDRGEGSPPLGTHRRHLSPARRAGGRRRRSRSSRPRAYDEASLKMTLADLPARGCRWPVNSPEPKGEYLFCGHQAKPGHRYCPHHVRRSVLLPELRHDRHRRTSIFCNQLQIDGQQPE